MCTNVSPLLESNVIRLEKHAARSNASLRNVYIFITLKAGLMGKSHSSDAKVSAAALSSPKLMKTWAKPSMPMQNQLERRLEKTLRICTTPIMSVISENIVKAELLKNEVELFEYTASGNAPGSMKFQPTCTQTQDKGESYISTCSTLITLQKVLIPPRMEFT